MNPNPVEVSAGADVVPQLKDRQTVSVSLL